MNHLISIYDFIYESVESYQFQLTSEDTKMYKYEFEDMVGNRYLVEFKNIPLDRRKTLSNLYELLYYVFDKEYYSVSKIVNVNPYRVLETVFGNILNDFISRCPWATKIYFVGLSKDREKEFVSSRTKIYKRYLDMNPPVGFTVQQSGNNIQLTKK